MEYNNPFIIQRADPYITKGHDGYYYFTASYPAFGDALHGYDRIILRRSETVSGLAEAEEKTIWKAHDNGSTARHIWAPEIHFIDGKWYVFFAAANWSSPVNLCCVAIRGSTVKGSAASAGEPKRIRSGFAKNSAISASAVPHRISMDAELPTK